MTPFLSRLRFRRDSVSVVTPLLSFVRRRFACRRSFVVVRLSSFVCHRSFVVVRLSFVRRRFVCRSFIVVVVTTNITNPADTAVTNQPVHLKTSVSAACLAAREERDQTISARCQLTGLTCLFVLALLVLVLVLVVGVGVGVFACSCVVLVGVGSLLEDNTKSVFVFAFVFVSVFVFAFVFVCCVLCVVC